MNKTACLVGYTFVAVVRAQHCTQSNESNIIHSETSTVNNILLVILVAYIPFITLSSILVIATVSLISRLHNPHNVLLMAIATLDLLTAWFTIPVYVFLNIKATREVIFCYGRTTLILLMSSNTQELLNLCMLTLLCLDTFLQIKFPIKYKLHMTIKATIACMTAIAVPIVTVTSIFSHFKLSTKPKSEKQDQIDSAYLQYMKAAFILLLSLCMISGAYARCYNKTRNLRNSNNSKIVIWLLMAFVVFYIPSGIFMLIYEYRLTNMDKQMALMLQHVSRAMRYLTSLTNGIFIYFSRPIYKFSFKYFLKNRPSKWNKVEKIFHTEPKSNSESYQNLKTYAGEQSKKSSDAVQRSNLDTEDTAIAMSNVGRVNTRPFSNASSNNSKRSSPSSTEDLPAKRIPSI